MNSEECNDELGLAQSKHKVKLPIYLEEVDLPDGMDMHLQRVQALPWYLYDEKGLFYEDLLGSTQLVTCLDTQKKATMDAKDIDYSSGKAMIGEAATARRETIQTRMREDEYGQGFLIYEGQYPLSEGTALDGETPFTHIPPLE